MKVYFMIIILTLAPCEQLFCPSHTMAIIRNPLLNNSCEYYMTVGLNSNLKESTFQRKKLNLIVVLGVSGSMLSSFDCYYYDNHRLKQKTEYDTRSKIEIAKSVAKKLIQHLNVDDGFGLVTFNDRSQIIQQLKYIEHRNLDDHNESISKLQATGGTNTGVGIKNDIDLFNGIPQTDDYDNRMIFITDAEPNSGSLDENYFISSIAESSKRRIYTTFIGVGIDFNTQLIDNEDFDLIVTPLVFKLQLNYQSNQFEIEHVYGSPENATSTSQLIKINTLFPSRTKNGTTSGGIVLLKLKKLNPSDHVYIHMQLSVSYEDRLGKTSEEMRLIDMIRKKKQSSTEVDNDHCQTVYYSNIGIRKTILLTNYATLLKIWIRNEREDRLNYQSLKTLGIRITA
ncbi:unnamed protein product [Didymodactylos carnosus]|uniref:VWFA domain-containing protein n=1 Tax=Didymodactylos carnosus TaxID=1234261 RepID=A0A815SPB9_9BILA|nr:unnamed protein product [Didymodactylos carnosus]CAF4355544.1 unnamed protein product [Didymodactylos carnosus]